MNSFFYEGMPPGTYLESVDVSSMNFKEFQKLANGSLNRVKSYVFKIKIDDRTIYLEQGRNLHFAIKKQDLLDQYRAAKKRVSFLQRLKTFVTLDYQRYDIPLRVSIDHERSIKALSRYFSQYEGEVVRLEKSQLVRSQKQVDYKSLFTEIDEIIAKQPANMYSLKVGFIQSSVGETIEQSKLFLLSEASTESLSSSRAYDLMTDLLNVESSILLNPGDVFSFKQFVEKKEIDLKFYEDPMISFDDYTYYDYHGLEVLASLILQVSTASGLQISENHYQINILPGASVTRNSFSCNLSGKRDLRILQSKREPLRIVLQLSEGVLSVGVYSFESPKETYRLKLDFYKSVYPTIESQEDVFLDPNAIKILRKPLNGLMSQFKRQVFRNGAQVSYNRIKKRKIDPRNGLLLVGTGVRNIYDPRILYTLGLQELNQAEN
ncbi:MAG: hypothetical protein KC646_10840 [Candidatus Cloacimonetes bacterium]|nr:hypothetical protein [Candidatus Cloacimonadota bacterium]